MKAVLTFCTSLLFALLIGTTASAHIGVEPLRACGVAVGISAGLSFMPSAQGAQQVVLKELFTAELEDKFRHMHNWLSEVPSRNEWVGNNAIRLNQIGEDPKVLINNNTYPIPIVQRTDEGILISLNKYETENTEITDDELYGLPYDKPNSVLRQHRETLEEWTGDHGSHMCSPMENTAKTPILETTGPNDGTGRKRLVSADIARLQKQYNDLKIPRQGRLLRLCNEHVLDLLIEDKPFKEQYMNHTAGAIIQNYYGFRIYEEFYNPVYNASNQKKAFNAVSEGTDRNASVACYTGTLAKARGTVEMYYAEAKTNPAFRSSVAGFRLWNVVIPKRDIGLSAIVSVPV